MKTYYLSFILILFTILQACNSDDNQNKGEDISTDEIKNPNTLQENKDDEAYPVMTFETTYHNFGKIEQGEVVKYDFKFKNTGNAMLIITSVNSTCGCTVPSFPRDPVMPGDSGVISVEFNSRGKSNIQKKPITIMANTNPRETVLNIEIYVEIK
jgi:Protein of unknown function (DUF1573)